MMTRAFSLVLLLAGQLAWCEAEAAHELEIPWTTIGVQAFNFLVLVGLLVYLLRKTVAEHFQDRYKAYTELVDRAESAKAEAQKSHREISQRLNKLQSTADESVRRAKAEAAELKQRLMDEAGALAKKMDEDAKRSADLEIDRAKAELRAELLTSAMEASRTALSKLIGSSEQKRLQTEFVDKIQVVGQ